MLRKGPENSHLEPLGVPTSYCSRKPSPSRLPKKIPSHFRDLCWEANAPVELESSRKLSPGARVRLRNGDRTQLPQILTSKFGDTASRPSPMAIAWASAVSNRKLDPVFTHLNASRSPKSVPKTLTLEAQVKGSVIYIDAAKRSRISSPMPRRLGEKRSHLTHQMKSVRRMLPKKLT